MTKRAGLPTSVDVALASAVSRLQAMHEALEQGRRADAMFGGGGRYEADAASNRCGGLFGLFRQKAEQLAVIERWRSRCPADIDFDELLAEYGDLPEVWLSVEGFAYLSEQLDLAPPLPSPSPGARIVSLGRSAAKRPMLK